MYNLFVKIGKKDFIYTYFKKKKKKKRKKKICITYLLKLAKKILFDNNFAISH